MLKQKLFQYIQAQDRNEIQKLLNSFPSLIQSHIDGLTPLMYSIKQKKITIFELLLDYHQDFTLMDKNQNNLLHLSTQTNSFMMTNLILKINKIDINQTNKDNLPPLYYAANHNNEKLCHLLIENGAYINNFDWINNMYHNYELKSKLEQYQIAQSQNESVLFKKLITKKF